MRIISGSARGTNLYTLDGMETRPTLDRIKESLFSIIQNRILDACVLDLFAGSGALGIESLSRGAQHCVFCDCSYKSTNIVKKNLKKTKFEDNSIVYTTSYQKCLEILKKQKMKFDIIFLDPPYKSDFIFLSVMKIIDIDLLNRNGIIIAETDEEKLFIQKFENTKVNIQKIRKYGRVKLLFLERRG